MNPLVHYIGAACVLVAAATAYPTDVEEERAGTIVGFFSDLANNVLNTFVNAASNTMGIVGLARPPYSPSGEPVATP
uniref:Putative secreted protein n=1 Tax=Amblyomma triste TaxID=251400 RepID=A0A023G308_AMBTT